MNNKSRFKVLLQTLNMVYDSYPNTGDLIHKSLAKICRDKTVQVDQVFSVCFGFICCCHYLEN